MRKSLLINKPDQYPQGLSLDDGTGSMKQVKIFPLDRMLVYHRPEQRSF